MYLQNYDLKAGDRLVRVVIQADAGDSDYLASILVYGAMEENG